MQTNHSSRIRAQWHEKQRKGSYYRWISLLLISVLIAAIMWGLAWLHRPTTLPFRHLALTTSAPSISISSVKKMVYSEIHGGFFSLNIKTLEKSLLQIPWVDALSVRRVWPDRLVIHLTASRALARWNETQIVSERGKVFSAPLSTLPTDLPVLRGPANQLLRVVNYFKQLQILLLTIPGVRIKAFSLSKEGTWMLQLSTATHDIPVTLGQDPIIPKFQQFISLYHQVIGDQLNKIDHIDLRYHNGFAIKWRSKSS